MFEHLCCRHRTSFKDWRHEKLSPYATPRMKKAAAAYIVISGEQLSTVSETAHCCYPSDHHLIRVLETKYSGSWLTVYSPDAGNTFGLRPSDCSSTTGPSFPATFRCQFADGSSWVFDKGAAYTKKPDGYGTIVLTQTFSTGLVASYYSSGELVQSFVRTSKNNSVRKILNPGIIV